MKKTKAERMLNDLGYIKKVDIGDGDFYWLHENGKCALWFFVASKEYDSCDIDPNGFKYSVTLEEHKAIHELLKELGWLDEEDEDEEETEWEDYNPYDGYDWDDDQDKFDKWDTIYF